MVTPNQIQNCYTVTHVYTLHTHSNPKADTQLPHTHTHTIHTAYMTTPNQITEFPHTATEEILRPHIKTFAGKIH